MSALVTILSHKLDSFALSATMMELALGGKYGNSLFRHSWRSSSRKDHRAVLPITRAFGAREAAGFTLLPAFRVSECQPAIHGEGPLVNLRHYRWVCLARRDSEYGVDGIESTRTWRSFHWKEVNLIRSLLRKMSVRNIRQTTRSRS